MDSLSRTMNPEDPAHEMMQKSFLKSRDISRESGSVFFIDNKVRSCSFVKETKTGFKAIPFYDKRDNKLYPTPSTLTKSWYSKTHSTHKNLYAGMGTSKPITPYDPQALRSKLYIADFRPNHPSISRIQIGERSARDVKHYTTTYSNSYISSKKEIISSNPAIRAMRNQWNLSRLRK